MYTAGKLAVISALVISAYHLKSKIFRSLYVCSSSISLLPAAKKVDFTVSAHGRRWQDPYHWMSKKDDPDFVNYLHQENSYTDAFMSDIQNLQRSVYNRMTRSRPSTICLKKTRVGSWVYRELVSDIKNDHQIITRKLETGGRFHWMFKKDAEQVLVDFNRIKAPHGYVRVNWEASPDNRYLAYAFDIVGDEQYKLHIIDLENNCSLVKEINNVKVFIWANDSCSLLYTSYDENHSQFYPHKVQLTKLGSDRDDDDVIIYTESDPRFTVHIYCTTDKEYVIVYSECLTETSSEIYVLKANKLLDGLRIIYKRMPGVSCFLEDHRHGFFYIKTNAAPVGERKITTTGGYYRTRCLVKDVELDSWEILSRPHEGVSSRDDEVIADRVFTDLPYNFVVEKKDVISHDGERIPLTIVYSPKARRNGESPGLLHGYGAYRQNCTMKNLNGHRICLLDAGWILAFADVRGGSCKDPCWHEKGRRLHKINSIKDFVSCGEFLISKGYVNKYRLAARGCSAGGLLVAAAITKSPQLFRGAILEVPLVDLCKSLLDASLPLKLSSCKEFGNPTLKSEFESVMSISPYNNIRKGVSYPSMLVTSYFHDARVPIWEAAKWVAKIRESTITNSSSVLLKTSMVGGHLGEDAGNSGYFREEALQFAFLMKTIGMQRYEFKQETPALKILLVCLVVCIYI